MPPFPERESSILAKLKKKKPSSVQEPTEGKEQAKHPQAQISNNIDTHVNIQPQVSDSLVVFVCVTVDGN